jgi:hypothetical protein
MHVRTRMLSKVGGGPVFDNAGGLNGSLQHWLAVYAPGFQTPKFFLDADLTSALVPGQC